MKHNPADRIQDLQNFGEYGGVNPSIADSSTFTYLKASTMQAVLKANKMAATCIHVIQIRVQVIWQKH